MKSNSISLEDELKTQDQRCKRLLTGEWISLVLSGVGTVVTVLTNQAVFAATPLTCSLFLNILSRSQQDKRIYDQNSQNLIEVQRQYASKIQGLRSEFLGMDFSEEGFEGITLNENLEELATKVKQLESFLEIQGGDYYSQGGAVNQEVSILRNHQLEMAEAIETLTNQIGAGIPDDVNQNDIIDHLERLSAAVYELEQKTAAMSTQNEFTGVDVNPSSISSDSPEVTSQLESIQSQMMALEERMNFLATSDPAYDPDMLKRDMEALISPLQNQISTFEGQIQEQQDRNNFVSESSNEGTQIDAVNENVSALQIKLDTALAQISADISDFQGSLQQTHEQMGDIQQRMSLLKDLANETAASHNPASIQKQIDAVNAPLREKIDGIQVKVQEYGQLQDQLEQVQSLAKQSVEQSHPEVLKTHVSAATAPLMEKIAGVEKKVQAQAPNQDIMVKLQQVIEPLQSHMLSLEQRINQLSSEGDRTPLLQKIAALQGNLQNVESRLNAMPDQAPDNSDQIHQLTAKIVDMQSQLELVSTKVSKDMQAMPQIIEKQVQEKESFLSELQTLSFEEEITGKKKEAKNELDDLLNSLKL